MRDTLTQLEEVTARLTDLEGERARLESRRDELAAGRRPIGCWPGGALEERYAAARADCQAAREALSALEAEERDRPLPDREACAGPRGNCSISRCWTREIRAGESALREAEETYAQAQRAAQDERFQGLSGPEAWSGRRTTAGPARKPPPGRPGRDATSCLSRSPACCWGARRWRRHLYPAAPPVGGGLCLYLALSLLSRPGPEPEGPPGPPAGDHPGPVGDLRPGGAGRAGPGLCRALSGGRPAAEALENRPGGPQRPAGPAGRTAGPTLMNFVHPLRPRGAGPVRGVRRPVPGPDPGARADRRP